MDAWRVEELAEKAGVSIELIRSYQSKHLLPPPRHQGRVALYGQRHLDRLKTIRDLKARGHSLRAVAAMLNAPDGTVPLNPFSEGELADAERLSLSDVAERTGMPVPMLRSLEASGILRPVRTGAAGGGPGGGPAGARAGEAVYTAADVRAVRMLLVLVGSGVPMESFMAVARVQLEAADAVANGAVELFMRHIREPLLRAGLPQRQEADRMVASFRLLVQAASSLISYNFERTMLEKVQAEIEARGTRSERAAIRREAARRNDVA